MALLLFPLLLFLGKLASFGAPPTYFASKGNIFNRYFVKAGWFWTTLAFWAPYLGPSPTGAPTGTRPKITGAFCRYAAATFAWIIFSQWMWGPPLMDRIFVWTGGMCHLESGQVSPAQTSKICRSLGGQWQGGHDPSGHFFLLMLSSMLLVQENIPFVVYLFETPKPVVPATFKFTLGLLALWVWMFFVTAVYFHSFTEKLSGLMFAYIEIVLVYLGPFPEFFAIHELGG